MRCAAVNKRLNAYLDGELSPATADSVREHLRTCSRCAEAREELKRVNGLLAAFEAAEARPGLAQRIRAVAEARPAAVIRLDLARAERFGLVLERAAAAAALLAGVMLGVIMGNAASQFRAGSDRMAVSSSFRFDASVDPLSAVPAGSVADIVLGAQSGGTR